MDKKSSMSRIERQKREKVLRFSIRKYSFGAASVAVAALMFLGARVVSADSVTPVDQPHVEALTQDTSPLASQAKEEPTSSVKVDTAVASQLVTQLKDQLKVKETAKTDLLVVAKEELVKAEQTLADSKVSQEEVDALVARLTNVLDQLRAVETPKVKEEEKNDRSAQDVTPEIKPEVAKSTSEISAKSEETSANTNAEQLEKAKASLKLSIDRLEQTIAQTPENDLTREILEKAIAQVAVAKSAFGGVEVSLRDVEDMNRVIKRNESSVMIARNRLTSGSHDPRNGQSMDRGSNLRSVPIDKDTKRGQLEIVVADSGFITGYATPSSTIQIKKNGQTLVTSTLDDSGQFKLNAPGIKVGDTVTLVVNGTTVATEVVSEGHTVSFNDSLAYIKQVDGYTAAESDVEITVGGQKYKTKSQSNGYFTVDVDPNLMVVGAEVTAVVTKDGKVVGRGTSIVRATKVTDFGVGWTENPMIDYSHRDVFSPDTKQYAFVSKGKANQAYDNIRVYREMRIEENGSKYYYWIVDSGPAANAQAGLSKKISLAIPRTVGDPYDFTYTQIKKGKQESYKEYPTASAWEYDHPVFRAYVKDGEKRSGSSYAENADAWMDYIEPSNSWKKNIYRKNSGDGTEPNADAFPRVLDMLGIKKGGLEYNLVRGVIEDKMNVTAGNRTIMTFKTKVLEGDELDQSIMSDWGKKDKSNPMLSEIKSRLANDPYLAYGGYTLGGRDRYKEGQNAIIGTLPLRPEEATNFNFQPVSKEQTTKVGVVPDAIKSIGNTDKLPKGTTYRWFKDPDVSKVTEPGKPVHGTVEVVIPQRGTFLVDAAVHVIDDKPQTPVATAKDNGDVTAKPQDSTKVDKITVSYTGEDNKQKTAEGKKDPKGNWTVNTPEVQINPNTGEITIPENKVKDGTEVTVITKNGNGADSDPAKATAKFSKPAKPVATAKDNGDVTGKPQDPTKADKITVSYIGEDNQPKTAEGKKDPKGNWTVNTPEVQINPNTGEITIPENKVKDGTEVTVVTKNGDSTDSDPAKAIAKDVQKPQATLNGVTLTETANSPIFTVYRGAVFNPELKVWDNSGVISKVEVKGGLPKGVTASTFTSQTGKTEENPYATRLSSGTVLNTETLGEHEATLHVEGSSATDSRDLKFKYRVVDIESKNLENGIAKVPVGSTLNVANSGKNIDAHNYLKVVDSEDKADRVNNYLPSGMTWTWKQGNSLDGGTTLDNSGKYTRFATAIFPQGKDSFTDATSTTRRTFAPAEIKRQVVFAVTPTAPSVVANENGSVTITPPTVPNSTTPQDVDTITLTYTPTGKTTPETVTVTKSGNNWTVNGKSADKVSVTPAGVVTISDAEVADKTEVTAKVSKTIENNVVLASPVAKGTAKGRLVAEVIPPAPVTEKEKTTPTKVVTPNKPGSTITTETPVNGLTVDGDGNLTGTPTVTDWGPKEEERKVTIPVKVKNGDEEITVDVPVTIQRDTDGDGIPDVKDPDDDNDGIPDEEEIKNGTDPKAADKLTGTVTDPGKVKEKAPVPPTKVVTPNKPGSTITTETPVNGLTVDGDGNLTGTPTVDNWGPKEEERKVTIPVKVKNGDEEITVDVPVTIQRDTDGDGIPDVKDPDDDNDGIPDEDDATPKVADKLTGTVTDPGKVKEKAPVPPTKVVTPNKPGSTITTETPVNGLTVDGDGNLTGTPTVDNWGPKEEERKVTIPVKVKNGDEEVTVDVPVTIQRDTDGDGIPDVKDPDDDNDGIPDKDEEKNGTDPKTPTTQTPTIEITRKPNGDAVVTPKKPDGSTFPPGTTVEIPGEDGPITVEIGQDGKGKVPNDKLPKKDVTGPGKITEPNKPAVEVPEVTTPGKFTPETPVTEKPGKIEITPQPNGDAIVTPKKPDGSTYPSGSKVEIPGENGTTITVTIGDNGSGEVPNDKLPKKDVTGTGTVTEPNKKPSQPVDVTTPARKTPTLDVERDPKTGDVTVTPKKPDGSTFPPGTTVEIPGEDGPITVEIGQDGKGKVPNDKLPKKDVTGPGKITEPNKPAVEVPEVTTPGKFTPETPVTEKPGKIEITPQPNGDAIVTPKKPDGSTYPSGSKVEIPGENGTTITVTIGDNGSGEVPNDKLPKKDVTGTGTVTEPNKKPSQPVDVTTPARKTPTLDVERDPKTGDVTVTPKKPDGSTFPPGTTVEIPGEDGPITVEIGQDGKGKVPNDKLPKKDVTGPGKITEPNKPAVEVPEVTTPGKFTPETPVTEKPGKIEITPQPNGDAIVTPKKPDGSTYPSGSKVEIPGENGTTITVTIGDNGSGEVPNDKLPKKDVTGTGTVTEPNKKPSQPVDVTTPARKTPTLDVERDPKTGDVTVTPKKPDGSTFPPGTTVEIPGEDGPITVEIGQDGKGKVPNDKLPKKDVTGPGKITEPNKPAVEVPEVTTPGKFTPETPVTEKPGKIEITPQPNGDAIVTPKKPDGSTYPSGSKVEIPGENGTTITVTIGDNGSGEVPNDKLPKKDVTGTGTVTEPNKKPSQPVDVTTPARKTPTLDVERDPKTGDVTVTPKKPDGSTFPPGTTVEIPGEDGPITVEIGQDGKGKVPNDKLPKKDVTGPGKITEPNKPAVEVPEVTTPGKFTPETPVTEKPGKIEITPQPNGDAIVTPKKPDGSTYPSGSKVEIPGENGTTITVTIGDNGSGEVPNDKLPKKDVTGTGTVTEPNKKPSQPVDVTTPARKTPTLDVERDPKTGDVTVTPKKPDGSTFPPGTTVEIPGEDGPITVEIGQDGKGKVPNDKLPKKDVTGPGKITEPNKPAVEVPEVTTPGKFTPETPVTEKPGKIEITPQPNGDAIVTPKKPDGSTYPSGSKVEIPGENGTTITVTIGDNGSGEVPNDKLPKKDVTGTGTVTEPNKKPSQPVDVTTPARKTPTLDVERDPKTGDVTVTPKKPDGSTFPPGTTVEIPGEDGPITVEIGQDGKGKVPNDKLPKKDVTGPGKITEPNKPAVEVPEVTTPGKFTPETPVTEKPGKIEITPQPNGDAIVTPKKPDGSTYPSGSKVEIPGENGTTITVTIGDNGSGEVPNDKLPKKDVTGTGTVTEPNKKPSQPVDVTTPARKTPTLDVERDPKTGDVTVTPKKPDGSTFPPGTTVEIPGEDGPITVEIGQDGKGKVPNDKLPKKDVTGPGKITEPNKPAVEVPEVTTPGKFTPETPVTEKPGKIEITPQPNGDAIVTPKKPDGSTYPSGSKVEIPGENGTTITVTIGDNGSGEVPNDKLPKKDVTGTGTVTEPNKKPSQPVDVTTPARKTPTLDVERDPKTGDVTVTPKKPDGSTFPPGTTVEIPGEDGPITVEIGQDGKGKVPNDKLPKKDVTGPGKITEPNKPAVEVPEVTTPGKFTPETPVTEKPGKIEITPQPNGDAIVTPKKPDGSTYPSGSKVEIPGENGTTITVTIGDNGSGEVPNDKLPKKDVTGTGTVTEPNKKPSQPVDVTTPARKTPTLDVERDPKTGDVTVTPKKPDGSTFPPGTTVEIPGEDGPITVEIGQDGKGKVPNDKLPKKDVTGPGKITEPNKPAVEVPEVTTPGKFTPETPVTEKPGKIEITPQPNGDAIVTPKKPDGSTYPSGSKVEIPGENGTTITVTIGDNGSGEVPNDKLPKKDVTGTGTVTEPNKKPSQPVDVTTPARKTPTLDVERDPKTGDVTVTPKKPDGSTFPPGTTVEIPGEDGPITVEIGQDGKGKVPNDKLPKKDVTGPGKITEPNKPAVEVPEVTTPGKFTPETPVTEKPGKIEITPQPNGDAIVTPKKPDGSTYPSGSKVEIPGENGTTITVTIGDNGSGEVPNDKLPKKDVTGTGTVTEPNKKPSQPVDVTTPARKTPTLDVERDPKTGDVTVTPKKPDGSTFPPGTTVEIPGEDGPITVEIGQDGKGKVPNDKLPKKDVTGPGKITEPNKPAVEVPEVTTPGKFTPETPVTEKPGKIEITPQPNGDAIVTPKKPDGSTYPSGSKVEIPGENGTTITVTIGDNGSGEVPNDKLPKKDVTGTGTVTEPNKKPSQPVDVTTPARKTPTLDVERDPKTGDVTVTPKKPDGSTFPPGTTVEIPGEDGPITVEIGQDGKGKVPNDKLPKKDVTGPGKITEPNKPAVEVPEVTTPGKFTPETPVTEKPGKIEITPQPNGDAIVTPKKPDGSTYPSGSKVEIPGENGTTITVTIGDNGSGEVPNDKLPKKDVTGTGTVTEPNKKPSQPVDVTTPARKTPTLDVERDPKTGDVTVTPKKPDGSTFPPGTTVEIPGEDGPITVEIGQDGKGKVPNDKLPKKDVTGPGKITEPNKPAVEVPEVTTPGKFTPETPVTEKPGKIEITPQPNGDAIVTPKKPDGSTYPSGSKVVIPGENNTPIEVTIGDNGSGEVPNDNLPKKDVPGTGTVTEPNKKPSQPVDVTTPARKTPTVDVEQDPKTGDVTVTPKKPDGSTFPPGTKVEIPGKDGNPITVTIGEDGKGKVPNSELPDGKVPGTGKITEPGKPAVEVPVTTPGKVTPATPTDPIPDAPVTPDTNGGSGQDTPAPATPTPNAVTPNAYQVDTKTTVDNGAKSNDSQNVLPNTGTESNATLASLGLLGILGGLGLALGKKKED